MIDKKSKIFLTLLALVLCASVAATYYRYIILQNYTTYLDPEEVPGTWDIFTS